MIDIKDVSDISSLPSDYDIMIFSTGYETRARNFYRKSVVPNKIEAPIKLCLSFQDFDSEFSRHENDQTFLSANFEFVDVDSFNYGQLSQLIQKKISSYLSDEKKIRVLIDYTVMRRYWYSEILQFFNLYAKKGVECELVFAYSTGRYKGKKQPKLVEDYLLLPGFEGVGSQTKDKYGIYSLGFDSNSMFSLHEWVEPTAVCCIVASPGARPSAVRDCLKINKSFLNGIEHKIIETPIFSVREYCKVVLETIKTESIKHDIVLFGGGPKPFVLGDFLCSLIRPQIANIYLKGKESQPVDVEATGDRVITKVRLIKK